MASLLLTKKLARFVQVIKGFDYAKPLPRHYQEALLFYMLQMRDQEKFDKNNFEPETIRRFQAFVPLAQKSRENQETAKKDLREQFANTYWYYLLFHKEQSG